MTIFGKIEIQASADKVWKILGEDFASPHSWASSVNDSTSTGLALSNEAPCKGRVCQTSLGPFTETILKYSTSKRTLSYSAHGDKMPGFVRGMIVTWKVIPRGTSSVASMEMEVDLKFPFNLLMALPMKMQLGKATKEVREELKYYAENDKPHPRKSASLKSLKSQRA